MARKLDYELLSPTLAFEIRLLVVSTNMASRLTVLAMTAAAAGRAIVFLATGGHETEYISSARQKHTQRRRIAYGSAPIPRDEEYAPDAA